MPAQPTNMPTVAAQSLDLGRLGIELAVVVGVGLLLNAIGILNWGEYTLIFVLGIMALNPDQTIAFFDGLSKMIGG